MGLVNFFGNLFTRKITITTETTINGKPPTPEQVKALEEFGVDMDKAYAEINSSFNKMNDAFKKLDTSFKKKE